MNWFVFSDFSGLILENWHLLQEAARVERARVHVVDQAEWCTGLQECRVSWQLARAARRVHARADPLWVCGAVMSLQRDGTPSLDCFSLSEPEQTQLHLFWTTCQLCNCNRARAATRARALVIDSG